MRNLFLLLLLTGAMGAVSCMSYRSETNRSVTSVETAETGTTEVSQDVVRYRYYYEPEIYYDTLNQNWFWHDHGVWDRGRTLPPHRRGELGAHVYVDLLDSNPASYHSEVRQQYPRNYGTHGSGPVETPPTPPTKTPDETPHIDPSTIPLQPDKGHGGVGNPVVPPDRYNRQPKRNKAAR